MNTELWTAFEAAAATGGALCARGDLSGEQRILPEESWTAKGLSIDTRTIKPGDMFVALQHERDGHDYVRNAFSAGASVALVSHAPSDTPDGAPLLVVNDTQLGLEALAAAARDRCFGQLIAVTGSAGKTSTKEQLRVALSASGKVHAAERSFNNHLGVPLSLAMLPNDADYGVFEIGMNHHGEITPLSKLVKPHITIITTVAAAHLEFFDGVEDIALAKSEIFSGLRRSGFAILPIDNPHFAFLRQRAVDGGHPRPEIITFGRDQGADIRLVDYTQSSEGSATVQIEFFGKQASFSTGILGEHQAMNALATIGAVHAAGANVEAALEAFETMSPVSGRGLSEKLSINGAQVTLFDESYNANPASMRAAINLLSHQKPRGRRIVVLGEMKELGVDEQQLHLELAEDLLRADIDLIFAAGDLMKPMLDKLPPSIVGGWAKSASDLTDVVCRKIKEGDVMMAKGSNASRVSDFVKQMQAVSAS